MIFNSSLFYGILILVSIIYLLYCVNPNGRGCLPRTRNFIFKDFLSRLSSFSDRIFGPIVSKKASELKNYIFFSNNNLVRIFYLFIAPGFYILYVREIMIDYYGYFNKIHLFTGNIIVGWAFYMYYKATTTDPGYITPENHEIISEKYKHYYDGFMFEKGKICRTCKTIK